MVFSGFQKQSPGNSINRHSVWQKHLHWLPWMHENGCFVFLFLAALDEELLEKARKVGKQNTESELEYEITHNSYKYLGFNVAESARIIPVKVFSLKQKKFNKS